MGIFASGGLPEGSFRNLESQFIGGGVGGIGRQARRLGDVRGFRFRNPFAKTPPKPGGIRPNPVQAGDDVVRAVSDTVPSAPAAGRAGTRQFPTPFVVKSVVYGGAGVAAYKYGPGLIEKTGAAFGAAAASAGAGAGQGAGAAAAGTFGGLGQGLSDLLGGTFAGAGQGVGQGVGAALAGVGEGLKRVALPAAAIGVGFLIFTALKKK